MFKTSKLLKISVICVSAIFIIGYTALWFYTANNISNTFDSYSRQQGSNFSYSKLKIKGFPFKIKAIINDLKFEYALDKANINMAMSCDQLTIKTNLLFNQVKFILPKKINYNVLYEGESYDFYDLSDGSYYLKLKDKNSFNFHNIIAAFAKGKIYTDFNLAKIHYHADGIKTIDQKSGQEIFNSFADLNVSILSKADLLNDLSVKVNSGIEMTNNQNLVPSFMNFIFHKTSIKIDLDSSFRKGEGVFEAPMVKVNNFEIDLDSTKIDLSGTVQNDQAGQPVADLKLKLTDWDLFFKTLISQQIISTNQYNLITYLLQDISGQSPLQNSFEVNIKSDKDGAIKFGDIDLSAVSYYIQQIALSQ